MFVYGFLVYYFIMNNINGENFAKGKQTRGHMYGSRIAMKQEEVSFDSIRFSRRIFTDTAASIMLRTHFPFSVREVCLFV